TGDAGRSITVDSADLTLGVSAQAASATGYWERIPDTHMRDVCPPTANLRDCRYAIEAWSGAAWDRDGGHMLIFGGGHVDYYGNEVYQFSLPDRAWRRLTNPAPVTEENKKHCVETFDSGKT